MIEKTAQTPFDLGQMAKAIDDRYSFIKVIAATFLFAALVLVVRGYELENKTFLITLIVACIFFPIHHFLPRALRLPCFVLISFLTIILTIGLGNAVWLIAIGCSFIVLAHLPVSFRWRVILQVSLGAVMILYRAHLLPSSIPDAIWPIVGSMFIFRMIIYMYDLKNKTTTFSIPRALAYFFMMPNASFTLLPVIDYKNLFDVYYPKSVAPIAVYQKGLTLLFKGAIHLLLYRLVYQNILIDPALVTDASGATRYMVGTFLLYLRISGYFHMISGLLHMYGFNLPETHHLYFLASSFTDFWRRINIFWKDFMQKIFFYPVHFRLSRKYSKVTALVLATAVTFFVTWILHAYQWFWIRGEFKLSLQDFLFWGSLGVVVLVNMLIEVAFPKMKTLKAVKRTVRSEMTLALKTILTFISIVFIWNVWSTPDFSELQRVLVSFKNISSKDTFFIGIIALGLGGLAILYGHRTRGDSNVFQFNSSKKQGGVDTSFWSTATSLFCLAIVLLFVNYFPTRLPLPNSALVVIERATSNKLNEQDQKLLQRGYYEDLTNVARFSPELQLLYGYRPVDWKDSTVHLEVPDEIPSAKLLPSASGQFKKALLETNSFGIRDKEYTRQTPDGTYRVAIAGASHTFGSGVNNSEVYESLVESRIDSDLKELGFGGFELLNLSLGGNGAAYKIASIEKTGLKLDVDGIIYAAIDDYTRIPIEIARHLTREENSFHFEEVKEFAEKLGVKPGMDVRVAELRLADSLPELTEIYYRYLKNLAERNNKRLWFAFIPIPTDQSKAIHGIEQQIAIAQNLQIETIDIRDTYNSLDELSDIWIAPWDRHPDAVGHEMLGERFYEEFRPLLMETVIDRK